MNVRSIDTVRAILCSHSSMKVLYFVVCTSRENICLRSPFSCLVYKDSKLWYLGVVTSCLQGLKVSFVSLIRQLKNEPLNKTI